MSAEVRVYDRDGVTLRGTFAAPDLRCSTSKGVEASDISFSVSRLEDDYTPTVLDDALGIVYADFGLGGGLVPVGTPFVLAPAGGKVFSVSVDDTIAVVGKGALSLTKEWPVLHHWQAQGVIARLGPQTRTFGWPTPSFDDAGWHAADVQDPEATTFAKLGRPMGFGDGYVSQWAYRDDSHGDVGTLTLFRIGSFVVTDQRKYVIRSTSDEEHKLYLNGHLIGEESDQETGYTHFLEWAMVLAPGTYFLAAEMTTVDSVGGDGFDALRAFVAFAGEDGEPDQDNVVLITDTTTKVWRQPKADPRPGLTFGELLLLGQSEAAGWLGGIPSATLLEASFDAALDSYGNAWPAGREITLDVGAASWGQALNDLADELDSWVDTSYGWHAAPQRHETNTVQLVPGSEAMADNESIGEGSYDSTGLTATRAIAQTNDGFVVYVNTALEATVDARAAYVESSEAQSIGEGMRLAEQWVRDNDHVKRTYTATDCRAVTGAEPWLDFDWGWTIGAFDETGANASRQVLSISMVQGPLLTFTYELGEV